MTPIEKNVTVIDEQGNIIGATYPKRAKGLIKKGRARTIDENTICLACPPNEFLEDFKMTKSVIDKNTGEVIKTVEISETSETLASSESQPELTIGYILKQIENIASQTAYLNKAISDISEIEICGPGVIGAGEKANAIADVVRCRETTNQKLISFYEKLYDDLNPARNEMRKKAYELFQDAIDSSEVLSGETILEMFGELLTLGK